MTYQPFTFFCYDLLSGTLVEALPFHGVGFGGQLDTPPGSFTGVLPITDARVQKMDWITATTPDHSFLVVDYEGAIVWSGVINRRAWAVDATSGETTRELQISASEAWFYLQMREQATDYSSPPYSGITGNTATMPIWNAANLTTGGVPYAWDPILMAAQVIADALSVPQGNPLGGMVLQVNSFAIPGAISSYLASSTATPASSYVAESFPFTSLQTIDAIVAQLGQLGLGIGFDWGIDVAYSGAPGSPPVAVINLSYPRRGARAAYNNLTCDLTRARKYNVEEDGTSAANTVYETGGNQDIYVDQNAFALDAGYPLLERVFNQSNLNSADVTALLAQLGQSDLFLYSWPPVPASATMDLFDPACGIGSFITGDNIWLTLPAIGADGAVYDPRFPAGLHEAWRIVQWQAAVPDEGDATLMFTFDSIPENIRTVPPL